MSERITPFGTSTSPEQIKADFLHHLREEMEPNPSIRGLYNSPLTAERADLRAKWMEDTLHADDKTPAERKFLMGKIEELRDAAKQLRILDIIEGQSDSESES